MLKIKEIGHQVVNFQSVRKSGEIDGNKNQKSKMPNVHWVRTFMTKKDNICICFELMVRLITHKNGIHILYILQYTTKMYNMYRHIFQHRYTK